jgi:hypothetical protein
MQGFFVFFNTNFGCKNIYTFLSVYTLYFGIRINLSKMLVWMIVFCNYSMKCFVRTPSAANNDAFWCSSSVHIRKYTWLIAKNIPKNIPHLYVNIFLFTNNRKFYIPVYGKRKYCLIMMSEHPWFYMVITLHSKIN